MPDQLDPDEELLYAVRVGVNEFLYSGILDHMTMTHEEGQEFTHQIVHLFKTQFPHRWQQLVTVCNRKNDRS